MYSRCADLSVIVEFIDRNASLGVLKVRSTTGGVLRSSSRSDDTFACGQQRKKIVDAYALAYLWQEFSQDTFGWRKSVSVGICRMLRFGGL